MNIKCTVCNSKNQKNEYKFNEYNLLKCTACGLRYINQDSLKVKPDKLYSADYFTEKHIKFFSDYNDILNNKETKKLKNFKKRLKKLKEFGGNGNLLDVGCGQGTFLYLAKKEEFIPEGCDISEYSKHFVEEKFHIKVNNTQLEDMPKNKKFNVITMLDFIEHTTDPNKVLDAANKLLNDGGLILIQTPNGKSLIHNIANIIYKFSFGIIKNPTKEVFHMYHNYHFTKENMESLLKSRGFEIIEYEKDNLPLHTVEGNIIKTGLLGLLYFVSRLVKKQIEMIIIAKKVNNH